jgi:hypothetical protein
VDSEGLEQPGQVVPGGAGLVTGPQKGPVGEAVDQPADRLLVMEDLSTSGRSWPGFRIPTEIESGPSQPFHID